MDWNTVLRYEEGKLYWLPREVRQSHLRTDRTWNTRFAGKEAGTVRSDGYTRLLYKGKAYLNHRVVWDMLKGNLNSLKIDHINSKKSDNRIENLQQISQKQNSQRGYRGKGYSKYPSGYVARRNSNKYIGTFGTACGAYMASMMYFITN